MYSSLFEDTGDLCVRPTKTTVKLSNDQYGGIKGISVNHFLIGTWQDILTSLEDQRAAASLLSIDFEKAFNRMCHTSCLLQLEKLGADKPSIALVYAFLQNRMMSVKVGTVKSEPRHVPVSYTHLTLPTNREV